MSNRQDDIKDIVDQLQRLQIEQTALIQRIERLTEGTPNTPNAARPFAVGDRVRIRNPRRLQANQGTIIRIGLDTDRITVQSRDGSKIIRALANLAHID